MERAWTGPIPKVTKASLRSPMISSKLQGLSLKWTGWSPVLSLESPLLVKSPWSAKSPLLLHPNCGSLNPRWNPYFGWVWLGQVCQVMLNPAKSSEIPGIPWSSWWNPPFPSLGWDIKIPGWSWCRSNISHCTQGWGCPVLTKWKSAHSREESIWNTLGMHRNAGFLHAYVTISRWTLHLFMLDVPGCSDAPSAGPLPWYWNVSQSTCLRPFHSNYLAGVPPILDHWPIATSFLTNLWESPRASQKLLHDDSWKPKNAAASTQPSESQKPKDTQKNLKNIILLNCWICELVLTQNVYLA